MRLIHCAMCHVGFASSITDAQAAARFEAEHGIDVASVPVAVVCGPCATVARSWEEERVDFGEVDGPELAVALMH